jgi:hypothetical protein
MDLAFPSQVVVKFCEWLACKGLYPPQFLALGVQHDLLARAGIASTALNGAELV